MLFEHKSTSVLNKRKICRPNTINRNQSDGGEKWESALAKVSTHAV